MLPYFHTKMLVVVEYLLLYPIVHTTDATNQEEGLKKKEILQWNLEMCWIVFWTLKLALFLYLKLTIGLRLFALTTKKPLGIHTSTLLVPVLLWNEK